MNKQQFVDFLARNDFAALFNEAGWNRPASNRPTAYEIGPEKKRFVFNEVAELFVRVFVCETETLPLTAERNALDTRLRKLGDSYIAIFVEKGAPEHHLWIVPVRSADKRSLVRVEYRDRSQAEFLFGKLQELQFPIGSPPAAVDVLDRLNRVFQVNSADVTKKFYREFRLKHNAFVKGIVGIMDKSDCEWYASVMLNRLMFCYFIQKKGFLNLDTDYLSHKLAEVQDKKGEDQFYGTFYKDFLRVLFADGLNRRERSKAFERKFGRIPYLNGGMFEVHKLEVKYPDIDIPDSVFEDLFAFFDQWRWHLDTSLTATGRDINPDVLGYIFEQYINDRAQMGAYYTKEDITEYIARNTLVPWLFNETAKKSPAAFKPNGFVWQFLKTSADRYIFPAVRKGVDLPLPPEIEKGVAVEPQETLRARRAEWNKPAADALALPTEIWRETVARRQRCIDLRGKIASGAIADINDFITFNLDIRKFAEDLLSETTDHLFVRHFYDALSRVTVLDPTCGSGAFLFAALNILEPLYEICLTRMQEDWPEKFKEEISDLKTKYRGNLKYCIYKSIILRNLYGVDIMREATEIARLRLFLKMVAVVDVDELADNLGLDPLPDIDFNIRCGNTLVGFANPQGVKDAILPPGEFQLYTEAYDKVNAKAADIADLYERFKALQQTAEGSPEFYDAKKKLNAKLAALNDELDCAMAQRLYGINPDTLHGNKKFEEWKRKTQPFHWYSEFYGITVANGGFDVIIGNPPYLEMRQIDYEPKGFRSFDTGAVHALCMERSEKLVNTNGSFGMIVPLSLPSTQRMQIVQQMLENNREAWYASFSWRPAKLFDTVNRALTIFVVRPVTKDAHTFSTCYQKWTSDDREGLFERITYENVPRQRPFCWIPKFGLPIESSIMAKMLDRTFRNTLYYVRENGSQIYYRTDGGLYWKVFTLEPPRFSLNGEAGHSSRETELTVVNDETAIALVAAMSSNTFWWWYTVTSNVRHLNPFDIHNFPIPESLVSDKAIEAKGQEYLADLEKNSIMLTRIQKKTGETQTQSFRINLSKPIIDEIDELLAMHYGFTEEELDFIINYDIKYRMGDKLNEGE